MLELIFLFSTKNVILCQNSQESGHGKAIIYRIRKDKIHTANRGGNIT